MQASSPRDAFERVRNLPLRDGIAHYVFGKEMQLSGNDLKQIVEIVGDAAGHLAEGLHLQGLSQRLLRPGALRDFRHDALFQAGVRLL